MDALLALTFLPEDATSAPSASESASTRSQGVQSEGNSEKKRRR